MFSLGVATLAACANSPNIVFIMSDDHAANAISAYGSHLAKYADTKHLDRLAVEGCRLDRVYCTNSICVPSRASILTGLYSHRNQVYRLADALDPAQRNVAKLLQQQGYQTALVGKWHLKKSPSGFDYWEILKNQGRYQNPELFTAAGGQVYQGHSTDVITQLGLDWLQQRRPNEPFALFVHYKATHEPWHYADRFDHLFDGVEFPEPPSMHDDESDRCSAAKQIGYTLETLAQRFATKTHSKVPLDISGMSAEERQAASYQKLVRDYLRCVRGIDENVGRILAYLDQAALAENTVVIYTSDQGYFLGEHNYIDKRWILEESARMPTLIRYPPEIPAGAVNQDLMINTDFFPLLLDFANATIPNDIQGRSFRRNLQGQTPSDWRTAFFYRYWEHAPLRPAHYGIRTERYKLIRYYGNQQANAPKAAAWELYDLQNDPFEMHNVYSRAENQSVVVHLEQQLEALRHELADPDVTATAK
ncbi:MAG: sulfatase [Planctomycetales bacterium]|nr:sulfatase [Planctomycetales bacterium]